MRLIHIVCAIAAIGIVLATAPTIFRYVTPACKVYVPMPPWQTDPESNGLINPEPCHY